MMTHSLLFIEFVCKLIDVADDDDTYAAVDDDDDDSYAAVVDDDDDTYATADDDE